MSEQWHKGKNYSTNFSLVYFFFWGGKEQIYISIYIYKYREYKYTNDINVESLLGWKEKRVKLSYVSFYFFVLFF